MSFVITYFVENQKSAVFTARKKVSSYYDASVFKRKKLAENKRRGSIVYSCFVLYVNGIRKPFLYD